MAVMWGRERGGKKDNNADSTCCKMLLLWMIELHWKQDGDIDICMLINFLTPLQNI